MTTTARIIVLWGTPQDAAEFDRHYRQVQIPLAKKLPGLRSYTLSRNAASVRGGDPYYLIAELDFDDMSCLQKAFQSPEGQATAADVADLAASVRVHSMVFELEEA
ncbi:MAG: EthD family reductase [Candidatus Dormiibacterota bacterium]